MLAISSIASALPLLLFALALGERVMPADWTPLIGLALASQVLGQGMMTYALGRLSPLVIGIGLLIQPIVAAIAGWGWYGEILGPLDFVGAVLVAVALVLVRRDHRREACAAGRDGRIDATCSVPTPPSTRFAPGWRRRSPRNAAFDGWTEAAVASRRGGRRRRSGHRPSSLFRAARSG